ARGLPRGGARWRARRGRHGELRRRALARRSRGDPPLPDRARQRRLGRSMRDMGDYRMKLAVWTIAIAAAVAIPLPALAQQPDYSATYGQDRAEIEDLMARYLFAIDYADWDAYVATFAPDGELTFASGTSKGREAIREAVTRFAEGIGRFYHTADGQPAKLRH